MLILVLLQKLPNRANIYDLSRILEWKFHFFNHKILLEELEREKFISIHSSLIDKFILEKKGEKFIEENIEDFKKKIFKIFPSEIDFLSIIVK